MSAIYIIIKAIFLKNQWVKFVKVHHLGTEQYRSPLTEQRWAQPFLLGRKLGAALAREGDCPRKVRWAAWSQ